MDQWQVVLWQLGQCVAASGPATSWSPRTATRVGRIPNIATEAYCPDCTRFLSARLSVYLTVVCNGTTIRKKRIPLHDKKLFSLRNCFTGLVCIYVLTLISASAGKIEKQRFRVSLGKFIDKSKSFQAEKTWAYFTWRVAYKLKETGKY